MCRLRYPRASPDKPTMTEKTENFPPPAMNQLEPLQNQQLSKSKSTSSIFASATIMEPNIRELVPSVSRMLHCQMMRDIEAPKEKKQMLPLFCEDYYTGKTVKEVPALRSIYSFLKQVFEVGQFDAECCVIMLVYINRLIGVTEVPLTQSNWKPVTITALVLAQKVWDDTPLINADFSILYPALTVKDINVLERKFLEKLDFKLSVSPSLYAQYYFELRSICKENAPNSEGSEENARTDNWIHLSKQYQKKKYYYKQRTMVIHYITPNIGRLILQ